MSPDSEMEPFNLQRNIQQSEQIFHGIGNVRNLPGTSKAPIIK